MYNRNRSFRGPQRGGYRGGNFRRFGGFRRGGNRGFRKATAHDIRNYIAKATAVKPVVEEPVVQTQPFTAIPLDARLSANIAERGYVNMTPIQEKAIPAILEGKDVIGIANTGTGKTGAFIVPILSKLIQDRSYKALIITPTRELALQIRDELRKLTNGLSIYSAFCIGKSSMQNQIRELRRNPEVVIGTPGRLKDLIERNVLKPAEFKVIVLDEVDQMLDMGFLPDVKHIISLLPTERQSLFFSATVSPAIQSLIQSFVVNPTIVSVKKQETVAHITQDVVHIQNGAKKIDILHDLLGKEGLTKVLVFGRTKLGVEGVSRELYKRGHKVASIHGDKPQFKRIQAIRMFKEDVVKVLVATDVAARGLDIPNVSHVINYDIPDSYENYIHRIGRTGRANKKGTAITLVE